jgi:hypothetical protein
MTLRHSIRGKLPAEYKSSGRFLVDDNVIRRAGLPIRVELDDSSLDEKVSVWVRELPPPLAGRRVLRYYSWLDPFTVADLDESLAYLAEWLRVARHFGSFTRKWKVEFIAERAYLNTDRYTNCLYLELQQFHPPSDSFNGVAEITTRQNSDGKYVLAGRTIRSLSRIPKRIKYLETGEK